MNCDPLFASLPLSLCPQRITNTCLFRQLFCLPDNISAIPLHFVSLHRTATMVMDPYYDIEWSEDEEETDDGMVDGFPVPAQLEFLLPIVNLVHFSVLWTKLRIQHYGAMIPRKVFLFYPNHLIEDYTPDEIFFDDEGLFVLSGVHEGIAWLGNTLGNRAR